MPSFDLREEYDVFFDSKDCLSSDESGVEEDEEEEELGSGESVCGFWEKERFSVRERRESFFSQMGLTELDHREQGEARIMGCSGAESSSSSLGLSVNGEEEDLVNSVCCGREVNCGASSLVDDLELDEALDGEDTEFSHSTRDCQEHDVLRINNKKTKSWWKRLSFKAKGRGYDALKPYLESSRFRRTEVKHNSKRHKELTALYTGQEIQAHRGIISTMKFSPDGQYLASGGEDGVVRIWCVKSSETSRRDFSVVSQSKSDFCKNTSSSPSLVVIPDKVFHFEEAPLQELHGHSSDVLDVSWSGSNMLISSSKDQTVRLWQVGCDECVHVFRHNNYVTCIQFHPVDESFFISGSIDGIVRIWSIPEKRVVDWTDSRHIVTAVCYQSDGKGFVVGSIKGKCRFYDASGSDIQLDTQVNVPGRKKTSSRITGIQFSRDNPQRLMITSEDSKIRIYEKMDVVYKYKGCAKSGSQVSATFTSSGKHLISVSEDSRVYIWNYDESSISSCKHKKRPVRSCEHFFSEGASIAIPWSGTGVMRSSGNGKPREASSRARDSEKCSIGNWFSIDGPYKGSATWPEEELPCWERLEADVDAHHRRDLPRRPAALPETWGLVIVAAGRDGKIRTFHNYGLPVRL